MILCNGDHKASPIIGKYIAKPEESNFGHVHFISIKSYTVDSFTFFYKEPCQVLLLKVLIGGCGPKGSLVVLYF